MVCHFFNKTFSKPFTFLKKCFLLNLKPTSYLKEICNNDDERRVDKPLKATCPDYLYILFITKKSNSKMNITQWDISFVVAPHFTVTLTINKTLVLYYENNLINMQATAERVICHATTIWFRHFFSSTLIERDSISKIHLMTFCLYSDKIPVNLMIHRIT